MHSAPTFQLALRAANACVRCASTASRDDFALGDPWSHGVVVTGPIASDFAFSDQLAHGTDNLAERRRARHRDGSQVPVVLQRLTYVGVASMAWRRRLRRGGAPQLLCGVYRAGQCNK